MIVVSDTGPIQYLVLSATLSFLRRSTPSFFCLRRSFWSLDRGSTPEGVRAWIQAPPDWIRIENPREEMTFVPRLGSGETSALSLAVERSAGILADDLDARPGASGW